ncbi:diguanylate cyclase domain-containing protein [Maridesulfovibrio sp. FT414]|uniref:diguanylate cyclase domain-containing protein n=1 Tax=Maridesulfovibrio sp. FT414 TaxID=2979469 RepID=UPI003D8037F7
MQQTQNEQLILSRWIQLKLVVVLLVIIGIGGGIGLTLDNMVISEQESIFNRQQALQARLAATALSDRISSIVGTAQAISQYSINDYIQTRGSDESLQELFKVKQNSIDSLIYISLMKAPAEETLGSPTPTPRLLQARNQAALWAGKYYATVSGMHEGFITPRPLLNGKIRMAGMLVPVWIDKKFHGVLTLIIDLGLLADKYMSPLQIGEYGSGFIVDGTGTVLFDQEKEIIGKNIFNLHKDFPQLIKLDSKMLHEESGTGEYVFFTIRGGEKVRKLLAWDTVRLGDMKLIVAISAPESDATKTLNSVRTARIAMIAFMGFTIFVVLFFFYYYKSKQVLISQNEELRRKDRLFEAISMNVPGVIYKSDPLPPYTMDYISPKISKLTGYPHKEFVQGGMSRFIDLIHPADRGMVKSAVDKAIAANESFAVEYRLLKSDGGSCWVYERGKKLADENSIVGFIVDTTERKKEIEALHAAEEKYRLIVNNAPLGIYQTSPDGTFQNANPQMASYYGYSSPEDLIREISDISTQCYVSTDTRKRLTTILKEFGRASSFEAEHCRRDGSTFWAAETVNAVKDEDGNVIRYDGFMVDVSERKEHEETMRRLAMYDSLTGLPNRILFDDRIKQAISHANRTGLMVAILYADLDNFKPINDELGHVAGDTVLKEVAGRFSDCLRTSDTVSRIGGDEFIFILQDIGSKNEIEVVAQRIIDTMRSPFYLAEKVYRIGVSIGISIYPENSSEKEVLVRVADEAMYRAKTDGKNKYSY